MQDWHTRSKQTHEYCSTVGCTCNMSNSHTTYTQHAAGKPSALATAHGTWRTQSITKHMKVSSVVGAQEVTYHAFLIPRPLSPATSLRSITIIIVHVLACKLCSCTLSHGRPNRAWPQKSRLEEYGSLHGHALWQGVPLRCQLPTHAHTSCMYDLHVSTYL